MASLLHSESRRLYSWWWDSHISPKNSKWLQQNLTDMDVKVKTMIKLIEEDADSFAKRAEMYYKKRPELMKLVEEFYRAYRALAERYDHATGELRQVHRTMAEAFPNQIPFLLADDSPSKSSEPQTPELPHPIRSFLDPDDLEKDAMGLSASDIHALKKNGPYSGDSVSEMKKRGLKQLYEMLEAGNMEAQNSISAQGGARKSRLHEIEEKQKGLHDEISQLSNENDNLKAKVHSESVRAAEAEKELQSLKELLSTIENEKESVFLQYQQCIAKLSDLERELSCAQEDSLNLSEKASRAETEVETLKEALISAEAEKDAGRIKHEESLKRISSLEVVAAQAQENVEGLSARAIKAENESKSLKTEILRLESEKEADFHHYNQCLIKISALEDKILVAEENASLFKEQAERAEAEVRKLKEALSAVNEEKEASALQYKRCMEKIAELEKEISSAQEDVRRLNDEVLVGAAKLKIAEQKYDLLEMSNQSLRIEADNLAKKISMKDRELSLKQQELEELQTRVQDERLHHAQMEATLRKLENLHSQSQGEQRALATELKNGLQMLKDLETCKHSLADELRRVKDENHCLNEENLSSNHSMENLQNEISSLKEMKERLEDEVTQQMGQSNALQKEISSLREEIKGLNGSYQSLVAQVESLGLKPEQLGSSIRSLLDENLNLRQICEKGSTEKDALCKRLEEMGELLQKNALLESSLAAVNIELEHTREKVRGLHESSQFTNGEKSILVAEKAALLSQLQILTENMQKLLEKNAALENSLSGAKVELEGLREKSKGLEEICQFLKNEKTNLLAERSTLVIQLENVERRLENLERRFTGLEEKYAGTEKEKESARSEVEELRFSLATEKQERTSFALQSETRFTSLENHIHLLQEENKWRKKEFEEELDKAVKAQFEIYVLQKFIKDMEEKNYTLLIECQKHVEASKLAEKLISELESENLEQQVEAELLLDEIEKLRLDIYRILKVLETGPEGVSKDRIENEQTFVHDILENIDGMKCSLSEYEENNQQLLVENSVLLTLLGQLKLEGVEVESQKSFLEQEIKSMTEKLVMMQSDKHELLEMNRQLKLEVSKGDQQALLLESELKSLSVKQGDLQEAYVELQKQYAQVLEENRSLLKKLSDVVEEKGMLEQENDALLLDALSLLNLSTMFKNSVTETTTELKLLSEDLQNVQGVNIDLKMEISLLSERLEMKEAENQVLKDSVQRLEMELQGVRESNDHLKHKISSREEILKQREAELLAAGQRLEAADSLSSKLCETVDELKTECQESMEMRGKLENQIVQLSEHTITQNLEIESLNEVNANLVSEVEKLREEIQEQVIRGEDLSLKLHEKNNEYELWEAEASTFYFDLQMSCVREFLYENKVHELSGVCETLEDKSASKALEIQQMKEKINSMESEIGGLKSQLDAYGPAIASLRDDVASLERNAFIQVNIDVAENHENKCVKAAALPHGSCSEELMEGHLDIPNGIQDLHRLQSRIKAVETFVQELRLHVVQEPRKSQKLVPEVASSEIEELKTYCSLDRSNSKHKKSGLQKDHSENIKSQKAKLRASDVRDGIQMKDIPLDQVSDKSLYKIRRRNKLEAGGSNDQMLELWETSEDSPCRTVNDFRKPVHKPKEEKKVYDQFDKVKRNSRRPSAELEMEKELGIDKLVTSPNLSGPIKEVTNRKILERLASDAEKLASLQMTVQSLSRKLDTNKKRRKSRDIDFETVKEQLQEVEETVVQLADLNDQLMRTTEVGSPYSSGKTSPELKDAFSIRQKRVSEQARKGSERIGRLQLEVQKIQYMLLKLEEEKKSKGKTRFLRTKTSIILRDFIYSGKRGSIRRKKSHFCACFKPSTSRDGHRVSYS